jgi:hypothetical protein
MAESPQEKLAVLLFAVMVACVIAIALSVRGARGTLRTLSSVRLPRHALGLLAFWLLVVPLAALFPPIALLPFAAFLVLAWRESYSQRARALRILMLCSVVWLAYWAYEWQLQQWMTTVTAPIRVDMLLTAPLLYYASATGLLLVKRTSPGTEAV